MTLETVYDLRLDGCRYGFVPFFFSVLAVSSAIAWYRGTHWVRPDGRAQAGWSPRVATVFFGTLAVLAFMKTWGDYYHLLRAIEAGRVETVEGTVSSLHAAATIKGTESFEVSGHTFSYSKYAVRQGFNTLGLEGSPVSIGRTVRIQHVGEQIVRLEVAQ
jgi:hypothetical protein